MIFRRVVFPVPLLPMMATRFSALDINVHMGKEVLGAKDFARPRTVSTSFPLITSGSSRISMASSISLGFSMRSILSSIFSAALRPADGLFTVKGAELGDDFFLMADLLLLVKYALSFASRIWAFFWL